MQLHVQDLCRGCGKLFFHLEVNDIDNGAFVAFQALSEQGDDIPLTVFEDGSTEALSTCSAKRSFTVILPLVAIDVKLVCLAFGENGQSAGHVSTTLDPRIVKWSGRLNAALHRESVHDLRDCDQNRLAERTVVRFWDYLAPVGKDGLLRGSAFIPCTLAKQPPSLTCIDISGKSFDAGFVTSPARLHRRSDEMTAPLWEISFSARVPHDAPLLVFAAVNGDGTLLPGFETLEPWQVERLANEASYLFDNAQWDPKYDDWFRRNRADENACALQRHEDFAQTPLFSIIVPLFKTPIELFADMVDSVRRQTYGKWELILVNASPEDASLADAVREASESDGRIVAVTLKDNKGITLNTNEGVKHATGDFVSFFDHDDVLEPDILFEYVKAVNKNPETDILYCDEDKLTEDGRYETPLFKPDFSIDLLRSNNYVCHMLTIRASLLSSLPVQTAEFDGAQDHNLTLMAAEKARHVHHVPKMLYHWRMTEGSTAADPASKTYAWDAGIKAVQSHLDRCGIDASVSRGSLPFTYRVDYAVEGEPLVSIIIPNKDHAELLRCCLDSIFAKTTYPNFEIVVIENNSVDDETFAYYRQVEKSHANVRVETWTEPEFNYARIMNFGVSCARGDFLLLLNNDIEVIEPQWIELMLGICQRPEVGAVGAKLLYPDQTIQHAGVGITGETAEHMGKFLARDDMGYFGWLGQIRNYSAVTAACMMTRRDVLESVGGFEEELQIAYNDVDLCLKMRKAAKLIVFTPYAELYHHESVSRGFDDDTVANKARFHRETALMHLRWSELFITGDPYLNPNLAKFAPRCRYWSLP